MLTALLITFREGLEASLVLAVVLSFLGRTGAATGRRYVWLGAAGAAGLSLLAGALLALLMGEMPDEASELVEVAMTPVAIGALTYMIFWMRRHGAGVKGALEARTREAVRSASSLALAALAFAAVGREGLETVLFLFGGLASAGGAATLAGAGLGLGLAVITGVGLYRGSLRLDLGRFFTVTGVLLIVLAAGLLVDLLGEIGELGLPPLLVNPLWNMGSWLSDEEGLGALLKSIVGYRADPSPVQLSGYAAYLSTMLWLFLRPLAGSRRAAKHNASGEPLPASEQS